MTIDLSAPSVEVAPQLLGAILHGRGVSLRITEVEAYLGGSDPGSHAFRGPTPRNAVMFGPPGHLYTYFTYGMHVCANVVCSPEGTATAVLLRAGEIVSGLDLARERRPTSKRQADLASGPARLCVALGIDLADNGVDLGHGAIRLEVGHDPVSASLIDQGPRVGVSGPGGSEDYPWRFWIKGDSTVSRYRASQRGRRPVADSLSGPRW
ncbi:MAG TPA: DNA-3-methyladenine glycosylase [Pseudolysinimonas sp.]|nr:DNA-3-methyladenine glycosylase [Pseudolysinimonas sp.]